MASWTDPPLRAARRARPWTLGSGPGLWRRRGRRYRILRGSTGKWRVRLETRVARPEPGYKLRVVYVRPSIVAGPVDVLFVPSVNLLLPRTSGVCQAEDEPPRSKVVKRTEPMLSSSDAAMG